MYIETQVNRQPVEWRWRWICSCMSRKQVLFRDAERFRASIDVEDAERSRKCQAINNLTLCGCCASRQIDLRHWVTAGLVYLP